MEIALGDLRQKVKVDGESLIIIMASMLHPFNMQARFSNARFRDGGRSSPITNQGVFSIAERKQLPQLPLCRKLTHGGSCPR